MGFQDNYRTFVGWLKRERTRHMGALFLFGTVRALAVAALVWFGAILLGVLPLPARPILYTAVLGTAAAVVFALILPLLRAPGLKGFARLVDRAFPDLKDRTINSLELGGKLVDGAPTPTFEPVFVEALVRDTRGRVESLDVGARLRPQGLGRWAGGLAGTVGALVALLLLWPHGFGASARRLLHPSLAALPFGLRVTPGDVTLKPGEDVQVSAEVRGAKSHPRLLIRGDYEAWRESALEQSPAPTTGWQGYAARLAAVQRNMSYQVEVDGHRSPVYNVRIKEPLAVLSFRKRVIFPAYSSLPTQDVSSATGELDGLKGARAEITIETSGDVARAVILRGAQALQLERLDAHHFRAGLDLNEPGEYKVRLQEGAGTSVEAGPFPINVLPDARPTVTLNEPDRSGFFPSDLHLSVSADAADDYGIARAELVYQTPSTDPRRVSLNMAPGARQAQLALDWDASSLNPGPGESVTLWVEVRDNDAVSGSKMARSETRVFRVPSISEMFKANEAQNEENIQDLSRVSEQQKEVQSKMEQAARSMQRNESSMSWEKRKEAESAVSRQKAMLEKIQKTAEQINESLDKMEQQNLMKDEVLRKMEELRELIKQLDSPELREMLKKMEEALQKANPEEVKRAMENMKFSQQDLLATVERTLEALKQLQKTQKLNAAAKLAEEIAKQQKSLADQLEKNAQDQDSKQNAQQSREQAQKQADLKEQTKQLAKDVDQLKKEIAEQSRPAANKMDEAQKEMEQNAEKEMEQAQQEQQDDQEPPPSEQQAGQQAKSSKPQKNSKQPHAKAAHESMSRAAQQLRSAQQMMEQDSNEELAKKVRQAARDLVGVSGKQAELNHGPETPGGDMAREQQSLVDGMNQVVSQLQKAEQTYGPLPPSLMRSLGEAMRSMQGSKDLFEKGNTFAGRSLGEQAQAGVSKTVVSMLDAASSMCQNGGSGQGAGKKPGPSQRMSGLSQAQGEINRTTEQMMKQGTQRQQGGKPQQKSGGVGPGGQEMTPSQLAAQQDAVRQGIQDLAREQAQKKTMLGNLNDLADQMKKVADDMANNKVTGETVDMEHKILSRMLDAQRSINRRDKDPERWSRPGEAVARRAPGALPAGLTDKKQRTGLDLLRERRDPVPQPYQPAVEQYFRNLPSGR